MYEGKGQGNSMIRLGSDKEHHPFAFFLSKSNKMKPIFDPSSKSGNMRSEWTSGQTWARRSGREQRDKLATNGQRKKTEQG